MIPPSQLSDDLDVLNRLDINLVSLKMKVKVWENEHRILIPMDVKNKKSDEVTKSVKVSVNPTEEDIKKDDSSSSNLVITQLYFSSVIREIIFFNIDEVVQSIA